MSDSTVNFPSSKASGGIHRIGKTACPSTWMHCNDIWVSDACCLCWWHFFQAISLTLSTWEAQETSVIGCKSAREIWECVRSVRMCKKCVRVKRIMARGKWQSVSMRGYKSASELWECKRDVRICERCGMCESVWKIWKRLRSMRTRQKHESVGEMKTL